MTGEILEVQEWPDNAALIKAAFDMHVWPKRWAQDRTIEVLDPTYGRGLWWADESSPFDPPNGRRANLRRHDIRDDGVDYRELPHEARTFDVVAFDPDYVAPGGRATSTVQEFNDRYGLTRDYESPAALQTSINRGIYEMARVLKPQGVLLMKCQTYISSGKPWLGEYHSIKMILDVGLVIDDIWVHVAGTGPQPKNRTRKDGKPVRQQHARSNSSRLIIARKPGRRAK